MDNKTKNNSIRFTISGNEKVVVYDEQQLKNTLKTFSNSINIYPALFWYIYVNDCVIHVQIYTDIQCLCKCSYLGSLSLKGFQWCGG